MLRIGVVGCGLIGTRRANEAARSQTTTLVAVTDAIPDKAREVGERLGCRVAGSWSDLVADPQVDAVVVSTPNGLTLEIAAAALAAGKHVLVEKPPGRNLKEARSLERAAADARRVLKVGFNHRYHPAIRRARRLFGEGLIGDLINLRTRYGHGGRPGYEREWRGNLESAGGGELTDQGVHAADLINWFCGLPEQVFAMLQTAVWPIAPLEDNAFGLMRFAGGAVASLHTTWTQWKNLFSFEIFGEKGSLAVDGLGGSYGVERLTIALRNPEGGVPQMSEEVFEGPDTSWELEWADFVGGIRGDLPYMGTPKEGVEAMSIIDALYRSAMAAFPVRLDGAAASKL